MSGSASQGSDEDDFDVDDDFSQDPQSQGSPRRPKKSHKKPGKRGSPKGKAVAKRAAAKAKSGAGASAKQCPVGGCSNSKKGKSKWCEEHRLICENILTQGRAAGKEKEALQILEDPVKCAKAVQQHQKENPQASSERS